MNRKHGHSWRPNGKCSLTYRTWISMISRCGTSKQSRFTIERYRKRNIQVCDQWKKFSNFLRDMGERPSRDYSLDRIDNDGPYSPENCRWATRSEQARNRRSNALYEYAGKLRCVTEISELLGVRDRRLRYLLRNLKLPLADALARIRPIDKLPARAE